MALSLAPGGDASSSGSPADSGSRRVGVPTSCSPVPFPSTSAVDDMQAFCEAAWATNSRNCSYSSRGSAAPPGVASPGDARTGVATPPGASTRGLDAAGAQLTRALEDKICSTSAAKCWYSVDARSDALRCAFACRSNPAFSRRSHASSSVSAADSPCERATAQAAGTRASGALLGVRGLSGTPFPPPGAETAASVSTKNCAERTCVSRCTMVCFAFFSSCFNDILSAFKLLR
mmetsp:Transcript_123644/g.357674  ORF Transcript_123644/g.357674 Transcript_123644/m.357674 type:complete len:233 (+) Transcript_123644:85-783(+)